MSILKLLSMRRAVACAPLLAAGNALASAVVVLNSDGATNSPLDRTAAIELRRVDVGGKEPHRLITAPDGSTHLVANAASSNLRFLDPREGAMRCGR